MGIAAVLLYYFIDLLSQQIVQQNYTFIFITFAVILILFGFRSNIIPLVLILSFYPVVDSLYVFIPGLTASVVDLVPEMLSVLLFLKALTLSIARGKELNLVGIRIVLLFLGLTVISSLVNRMSVMSAILYLRPLLRYYLLFLAVINLDLQPEEEDNIIKVIFASFLIQLPLSLVKLFMGMDEEALFSLNGTALTTTITLVAIGFLITMFFTYKPSKWYLVLSLAFVGFGLIGGKRAIVFLLPVTFLFIAWFLKDRVENILKYTMVAIPVFLIALYFAVRLLPTLNPQGEVWGEFDLAYTFDYAGSYTTGGMSPEDNTSGGRLETTVNIFNQLTQNGVVGVVLGFGPGIILESQFEGVDQAGILQQRFNIIYGVTGLGWLSLQLGYIGALLYLGLFFQLLIKAKNYFEFESAPFYKSLGAGVVVFSFILLMISTIYSPTFINSPLSIIYFVTAGIVISKYTRRMQEHEVDAQEPNQAFEPESVSA